MPSTRSNSSARKKSHSRQPLVADIQYCQCCDCWKPIICNGDVDAMEQYQSEPARQTRQPIVSRPSMRVPTRLKPSTAAAKRSQSKKSSSVRRSGTRRQGQVGAKKYKSKAKSLKTHAKRFRYTKKPMINVDIIPYKSRAHEPNRGAKSRQKHKFINPNNFKYKNGRRIDKRPKVFQRRVFNNKTVYPMNQKQDDEHADQASEQSRVSCSRCGKLITPQASNVSLLDKESQTVQLNRTSSSSSNGDEYEQKALPVAEKPKVADDEQPDGEAKSDHNNGDKPENDMNPVNSKMLEKRELNQQ